MNNFSSVDLKMLYRGSCHPHFMDREAELQRGQVICPRTDMEQRAQWGAESMSALSPLPPAEILLGNLCPLVESSI